MFIATSWTPRYFSSHIPFVFSGTNCPRDNEVEFSSFSKNIKKDMILNEELAWICVNGINDPSLPWTNTWGETPWMDGWKMKLSPFGFYSNLTKKKSAAAAIPSARCRFQWDNLSEAIFVTKKKKQWKVQNLAHWEGSWIFIRIIPVFTSEKIPCEKIKQKPTTVQRSTLYF